MSSKRKFGFYKFINPDIKVQLEFVLLFTFDRAAGVHETNLKHEILQCENHTATKQK